MFLRMTPMKKLLKEAYKHNRLLIVHNKAAAVPEGYLISNRVDWIVWVEEGCMKKEFLASLIELVGELPAAGEFYVDGRGGKITVNDNESLKGLDESLFKSYIFPIMEGKYEQFNDTHLILVQSTANARILQSDTGETTLINNFVTTLVAPSTIDDKIGEFECVGPARLNGTHWMCWTSKKNIFAIHERKTDDFRLVESELLNLLRSIDLTRCNDNE